MLDALFKRNTISKIARTLPPLLVDAYDKQQTYTAEQVESVFRDALTHDHNIEYSYAMFCTQEEFDTLAFEASYDELRQHVSKTCFGSWPRFNFDTLLDYAMRATQGGDGAFFSGDAGDGGCGGGE
ncbi:DUF6559 family protein [Thalassotalea euphylliae]|uniref:DUF6559 family protein n=1 Tax=Thalassotalea euphylliae TaxID=1655234 RepID=UPI003626F2AA